MSTLRQQWTLPILEASALALRPNAAGTGIEVVAVADDRYEIARAGIVPAGLEGATIRVPARPDGAWRLRRTRRECTE